MAGSMNASYRGTKSMMAPVLNSAMVAAGMYRARPPLDSLLLVLQLLLPPPPSHLGRGMQLSIREPCIIHIVPIMLYMVLRKFRQDAGEAIESIEITEINFLCMNFEVNESK